MWDVELWLVLCPALGPHGPARWEGESQARSWTQWLGLVEAQESYSSVHRDLELPRLYFRYFICLIFLALVLNPFFWKEKEIQGILTYVLTSLDHPS